MIRSMLVAASVLVVCGASAAAADRAVKNVVILAGKLDPGHPRGSHEYERASELLTQCLNTSPNLAGIKAQVYYGGWPESESALDQADTIVVIGSGSDRNEQDHPLLVGDRMAVVERQIKRGCGLVVIHWSTFFPNRVGDKALEWIGGYFDYQSGPAANGWYSAIQHWDAQARPAGDGQHPVLRGVRPFKTPEEFYYNIRFKPGDERVKPILMTRPPKVQSDQAVAWAMDRGAGKRRGFGFTGGHHYVNWFVPSFRRMVLNAIAWTAGVEVPAGGVQDTIDGPIRALIITGDHHPAHDWKALTGALKSTLERDPRMLVDVTEKVEDLATRPLKGYSLLMLNYCNWTQPGLSEEGRTKFVEYLKGGGGLAVIHGANGAFVPSLPNPRNIPWPEFQKIVRRTWDFRKGASGHDAYGPLSVTITSVDHPITKGMSGFPTIDELYFKQAGDEPIEPLVTAHSKVTGKEEPMAWACRYGEGRMFQTTLGHSTDSVKMAQELILRGSVWASGKPLIDIDAVPPAHPAPRSSSPPP